MKRMKKLMALMIAMVMTLAMSVPAFATGNTPEQKEIKINDPVAGHTYTAYQILSGVKDGDQLTNLNWGTGITDDGKAALKKKLGLGNGATVAQVADKLAKITSDTTTMDEVAQILGDNVTAIGIPLDAVEGGSVAATVDQGYYVILDSITGDAPAGSTISKYMVQVVGDVAINTKAEQTTSQKTVQDEEDAKAKFTEANIGEARTFYLTAKLPADYTAYTAFYMDFQDKMENMDFVSITSVKVKRNVEADETSGILDPKTGTDIVTINAQDNTNTEKPLNGYVLTVNPQAPAAGEVTTTATTNLSVKIADLKQITDQAKAGDCVIVEYTAKLNALAVVNTKNTNKFELVFSNDPNDKTKPTTPNPEEPPVPTGTTPENQADLYTTKIELTKIDGTTKDILAGAGFTLTGETNNVRIEVGTTFEENASGEYWKLKDGSYTKDDPETHDQELYVDTETKYAPVTTANVIKSNGEVLNIYAETGADGKITFAGLGEGTYKLEETKVPAGYNKMEDKEFTITFNETDKDFSVTGDLTSLAPTIENNSGSTLPSTGGIGTTIFYIVGAVLVIGAAILLVTKKRMSKEA